MADTPRPPRPSRVESREAAALRKIGTEQPELSDAVQLQIEVLELYRRVQSRVPLPIFDFQADAFAHQLPGQTLLKFDDLRIEPSDLRLLVRQMSDVLHRHGALGDADYQRIQAVGRDAHLLDVARRWYEAPTQRQVAAATGSLVSSAIGAAQLDDESLGEILSLALRPWLSRCADVLQQRAELSTWTYSNCPLCGGECDLAVITPAAERHLVCGRCSLRWKFDSLTCPYCLNDDRSRITSFATPDGQYRVYACDRCLRYLKALDGRHALRPLMPMVDAIATLPLDAAAMQRGYR